MLSGKSATRACGQGNAIVRHVWRLAMLGCLMLAAVHEGRAAGAACPPAAPRHLILPATRAAVSDGRPVVIVAFGSSSTEGAGASAPGRAYPARLEALLRAHWPGVALTLLNRGAGGQTIDAMLARLDRDVLALHPALVIWQAGANEALRGADPARFGALLDEGVRRIVAAGGDVVLMDNQIAPRLPAWESQGVYGAILAGEATARSVSLFSRTALMREWGMADPPAEGMIGADGLHHTDRGYDCLAASLGAAITAAVPEHAVARATARK